VLVNWARQHHLRSEYALPLLVEAVLMLLFGLLGATLNRQTPFAVPLTVLVLAFTMGLQNALVSKISSSQIRTTHMTGVITDLGIELGKMFYWNRTTSPLESRVRANRIKLRLFAHLAGDVHHGRHGGRGRLQVHRLCLGRAAGAHAAGLVPAAPVCRFPARRQAQGPGPGRERGALTYANPSRPRIQEQRRRPRSRSDFAQVRALRFCTATCPTYQLLGDELDGPRGRIYLIKQVLEGEAPTRKTQLHLDRCLTCRNCETTCPSGVEYGHLVDIGRKLVDERVPRPAGEAALRWALKEGLPSPLFAPAMKAGQAVRGLLPAALKNKVPPKQAPAPGRSERMRARC
jgi:ferredoxin